jgi:hypothetical protein
MMKSPLKFDLIDSKTGLLNKPNRPQYTPKPIGLGLLGSTISNATPPPPGHRNPDRQLEYQRNIQQQQMDQQAEAGKILCAEWHAMGFMDDTTYEADQAYGRWLMKYRRKTMVGYLDLARPLVKLLRKKNPVVLFCASFLIPPWAAQMSHLMGVRPRPNAAGWVLMGVFNRVCNFWYWWKHR